MAFTLPSYMTGGQSQGNGGQDGQNQNANQQMGLDSITLGQLRAMVGSAPKPKVSLHSAQYHGAQCDASNSNRIMISVTMMRTRL